MCSLGGEAEPLSLIARRATEAGCWTRPRLRTQGGGRIASAIRSTIPRSAMVSSCGRSLGRAPLHKAPTIPRWRPTKVSPPRPAGKKTLPLAPQWGRRGSVHPRLVRPGRASPESGRTSLDNLQSSLSTPFPGCSPIKELQPRQGEGAGSPRSRSAPSASWTTSISGAHTDREPEDSQKTSGTPVRGSPHYQLCIGLLAPFRLSRRPHAAHAGQPVAVGQASVPDSSPLVPLSLFAFSLSEWNEYIEILSIPS